MTVTVKTATYKKIWRSNLLLIHRFVPIALLVFSSYCNASTTFLRGDNLYVTTSTGGADYVTSQVETTCGGLFTRRQALHQVRDRDYDFVVEDPRVVDAPFVLTSSDLYLIEPKGSATLITRGVDEIQYPYYRVNGDLYYWLGGSSTHVTGGVTLITPKGFFKGREGYQLNGSQFTHVGSDITELALPYFLKGNDLYLFDGSHSHWVATAVEKVSPQGYFLRQGTVYQVDSGSNYRYATKALEIFGSLAKAGSHLWFLDDGLPQTVGTAVTEVSSKYFIENDRLYVVNAQGAEYIASNVQELPCSSTLPFYLD